MTTTTTTQRLQTTRLAHPELGVPAEAVIVRYYRQNGRNVGQVLEFPDGIYCLTYAELRALRDKLAALEAEAEEE